MVLCFLQKPQTLEEAVNYTVANRLEEEKERLAIFYKEKEDGLLERLSAMEGS